MPYTITRNAADPSHALTANRSYEAHRDALYKIEDSAGTNPISSFTCDVNAIGQRETVTTAGSAFASVQANWTWQYDDLGQLTKADHANTAAADRAYGYDTIGNRTKTATGTLSPPTPTTSRCYMD